MGQVDSCRCVHFTGSVQGVGFRFTARGLAQRYAVTGYVANLTDGRVELVICGDRKEILAYLDALRHAMGDYIADEIGQWVTPAQPFETFDVRF